MFEKKLIQKIKEGDVRSFRRFYELNFNKVVNYAHKLLHSREDAKEIAQDVFIKIWNKRYELDPELSVDALMFRMTKYSSIDKIRKENHIIKTLNIDFACDVEGRSLEEQFLDEELITVYRDIVEKLPQKRKVIFRMSRDNCLSHKEISLKLNISTKTVEAQIRLALQQIREDIKKYAENPIIPLIILFVSM